MSTAPVARQLHPQPSFRRGHQRSSASGAIFPAGLAKCVRHDGNVRVSRAARPVVQFAAEQIAYLYGMTFATCGFITILQSVLLLRLPIVQGPYAGSFAALLAVGHLQSGGLGAAYGSFFVASLIWCVLTVPIRGFSVIGDFRAIPSRADHLRQRS